MKKKDASGEYQWDDGAMRSYFDGNGFSNVDETDPNARYFVGKAENKRSTADTLGREGMSSDGVKLIKKQADMEYAANMWKIQLDKSTNKYNETTDKLSNISEDAARAAGKTITEYKTELEADKKRYEKDVNEANSKYAQNASWTKKAEQEMKEHFGSAKGSADGRIFKRFQKGEQITGRDVESK